MGRKSIRKKVLTWPPTALQDLTRPLQGALESRRRRAALTDKGGGQKAGLKKTKNRKKTRTGTKLKFSSCHLAADEGESGDRIRTRQTRLRMERVRQRGKENKCRGKKDTGFSGGGGLRNLNRSPSYSGAVHDP